MKDSRYAYRRSVRVDDELWNAAKNKSEFVSISAAIRAFLRAWVDGQVEVDSSGKITVAEND